MPAAAQYAGLSLRDCASAVPVWYECMTDLRWAVDSFSLNIDGSPAARGPTGTAPPKAKIRLPRGCGVVLDESHAPSCAQKHRIGLKAPMTTPIGKGFRSLNLTLRKELQLYANVRPCLSIPGFKTRYDDVDLVTIRWASARAAGVLAVPSCRFRPVQNAEAHSGISRRLPFGPRCLTRYIRCGQQTERLPKFMHNACSMSRRRFVSAVLCHQHLRGGNAMVPHRWPARQAVSIGLS